VRRSELLAGAVLVVLGGVQALPAEAGWLVLRDGTPVETRGAWRIADNRVAYDRPDGRRVSVMIVVVDPEATRLANVPGAPPPAPPGPEAHSRRKLVIDNEAVKKNREGKPAAEKQKLQLAAVTDVLKTIAACAARYPNDAAAYQRCSREPR
jgi:hypothetical protein